ncbi:Protein of unknown function [Gryllus bimaculatus]|nr:Protein of unknown function [Gryllus bimaculatus]
MILFYTRASREQMAECLYLDQTTAAGIRYVQLELARQQRFSTLTLKLFISTTPFPGNYKIFHRGRYQHGWRFRIAANQTTGSSLLHSPTKSVIASVGYKANRETSSVQLGVRHQGRCSRPDRRLLWHHAWLWHHVLPGACADACCHCLRTRRRYVDISSRALVLPMRFHFIFHAGDEVLCAPVCPSSLPIGAQPACAAPTCRRGACLCPGGLRPYSGSNPLCRRPCDGPCPEPVCPDKCSCRPGFVRDSYNATRCRPACPPGGCPQAACSNSLEAFGCVCPEGFQLPVNGSGTQCEPVCPLGECPPAACPWSAPRCRVTCPPFSCPEINFIVNRKD